MRPLALRVFGAILAATMLLPAPVRADGGWLDDPTVTWNQPGMAIPPAPPPTPNVDPRCGATNRAQESPEEEALATAGWTLFGSYTGGWGVRIVTALAGYDGMCRPIQYQSFVFVDGKLAGTLSPSPMDSRSDGALTRTSFYQKDQIVGEYTRYTDQDPLCCPSARSSVFFKLEQAGGTPVLTRGETHTQPASQP
jgi:LppP/LprE lipoprotein